MTIATDDPFPQEIAKHIALEMAHWANAPEAFFAAWKQAVLLAGTHYFGTDGRAQLDTATSVNDLRPKVELIQHAIGPMSSGERKFIALLVSFYDTKAGARLWKRVGFEGLADIDGLDRRRREVIADLLQHYTCWRGEG
jgi:hypothetical protein